MRRSRWSRRRFMARVCSLYVSLSLLSSIFHEFENEQKLTLHKCVDITFTEPDKVADVNTSNCFNSSDISFNNVYSITADGKSSSAVKSLAQASLLPLAGLLMFALL